MSYSEDRRRLDNEEISCRELVSFFIDRIEEHNGELNAFCSVDAEAALASARRIDERRTDGDRRVLDGLVVGVKDTIAVRGRPMTCASELLRDFFAEYDATAVARLKTAGAVLIGKTNCDEFGMGSGSEYSIHGPVHNPVDTRLSAGGSSGGSAAAVAANLCHAALGSDTGGSVRLPAAFCGIFGMRPTWSRVSRFGLTAFASSMDTIGVLAPSAGLAGLVQSVIEGPDGRDAVCGEFVEDEEGGAEVLGLLMPDDDYAIDRVDERVTDALLRAARAAAESGWIVETIELPAIHHAVGTYHVLASVEAASNLARFDGVRYGMRPTSGQGQTSVQAARTAGLGPEVRRRILLGTYLSGREDSTGRLERARRLRGTLKKEMETVLERVKFILAPTCGASPFRLGAFRDRPIDQYRLDHWTIPASLAGFPALSVPMPGRPEAAGWQPAFQLIGPPYSDMRLLRTAERLYASLV